MAQYAEKDHRRDNARESLDQRRRTYAEIVAGTWWALAAEAKTKSGEHIVVKMKGGVLIGCRSCRRVWEIVGGVDVRCPDCGFAGR